MTVNERSIGPFYFAVEDSTHRWFWPHRADVYEMSEPYRTGTTLVFPFGSKLIAVGIWTRDINDDVVDFPNRWPDWMQSYEPDEEEDSPVWLMGGKFKPRAMTEEELDALEEEETIDPEG